jgi:hypothetical protein
VAQHDEQAARLAYEKAMRDYESKVILSLAAMGGGGFRVEIDETAPSHMISHHAIEKVILPALRQGR